MKIIGFIWEEYFSVTAFFFREWVKASARMSGKKAKRKDRTMLKEEAATIAALQKKTSLSANEIKEQHKEFKKICPSLTPEQCEAAFKKFDQDIQK